MTSLSSRGRVLHAIQSNIKETAPSETKATDAQNNIEETTPSKAKSTDTQKKVMEARALVSRLLEMPKEIIDNLYSKDILIQGNGSVVDKNLASFIDPDLVAELRYEYAPEYIEKDEYNDIIGRLQELLKIDEVRKEYKELTDDIKANYLKLLRLTQAYEKGELTVKSTLGTTTQKQKTVIKLDESNKNAVARQIVRILKSFKDLINQELQNLHNHVSSDGRDYKTSDDKAIKNLNKKLEQCTNLIDRMVATNHEVAIQIRGDELKNDSAILKRSKKIKKTKMAKIAGESYVEVPTRKKVLYGDNSSDNYILAALRNGQNVELLGPTGTGKTKLAVHAATVFAGKPPIVISGGPGVYRSTFYGSAKDLGKRNLGAVIQCIVEDRILIIDEDNRIDPRQMAEIKYILGLKPGDTFTHPDTGEEFKIPRHFAVMVTRNEKDKHHTDRFDLPPEYRREFTHGSFEIDYYTPDELYDHFFLPKLMGDDGSISLSQEEIGGDEKKKQFSPLLSLTLAAKEIQEQYKQTKLKSAVFESGYLIDVLNQWKEIRFKQSENGTPISFINFLETKLTEFIKRPIGNQDRKIIATILINHGFYRGWKKEDFSTVKDGEIFTDAEFAAMAPTLKTVVFKKPSRNTLGSREVALLDPFHKREIKIPPHPLENEINEFVTWYQEFSEANNMKPLVITPHIFEAQKKHIIEAVKQKVLASGIHNGTTINAIIDKMAATEETKVFLKKFQDYIGKLDLSGTSTNKPSLANAQKAVRKGVQDVLGKKGANVVTPETIQEVVSFLFPVPSGTELATIINRTQNLDSQDSHGFTAAMLAVIGGNIKIFKLLLENNVDVFVTDKNGRNVENLIAWSIHDSHTKDLFKQCLQDHLEKKALVSGNP